MQPYSFANDYQTSLIVSPYFATLTEINDSIVRFEVKFSILQSEIFNKSLSKLIINVINSNTLVDDAGKKALGNVVNTEKVVDKDPGLFEIENLVLKKNYLQIFNASARSNSIVTSSEVNLQSYIKKEAISEFKLNKRPDQISSLYESSKTLEESYSDISYPDSGVTRSDIRKFNYQLISQFLIDPSDVVSPSFKEDIFLVKKMREYYLTNALSSNQQYTFFKPVTKTVLKDRVFIKKEITIQRSLIDDQISFEFEIYEIDNKVPLQRIRNKKVSISSHRNLSVFDYKIPFLSFSNGYLNVIQDKNLDSFSISLKEINNASHCTKYQDKDFKLVENSNKKESIVRVEEKSRNKFSIYRCTFKDSSTSYSSPFFKNVVIGDTIQLDSTGLVIESDPKSSSAILRVVNPPYYASQFQILRRQLLIGGGYTDFIIVSHYKDISGFSLTAIDSTVSQGFIYEYIVNYKTAQGTIKRSVSQIYKHFNSSLASSISTEISGISTSVINGAIQLNFQITTKLEEDEIKKITEYFSTSGLNSFFSADIGFTKETIKTLFYNRITRINLKTGLREEYEYDQNRTFNTGNVIFVDSAATQRAYSTFPIDPNTNYRYEVRTFIRDPSSLIKDRVEIKTNITLAGTGKKRSYAYRPYKWRQPFTLKEGTILSFDDSNASTNRSILEDGEIGVTATYTLVNQANDFNISNFSAQRADFNKIKISWTVGESDLSEFDHFVLIKEVNKIRSFIGAVMSLEYVDTLKSEEYGTIIYHIIPVLKDYSIEKSSSTNEIVIDPEDLF